MHITAFNIIIRSVDRWCYKMVAIAHSHAIAAVRMPDLDIYWTQTQSNWYAYIVGRVDGETSSALLLRNGLLKHFLEENVSTFRVLCASRVECSSVCCKLHRLCSVHCAFEKSTFPLGFVCICSLHLPKTALRLCIGAELWALSSLFFPNSPWISSLLLEIKSDARTVWMRMQRDFNVV